MHPSTTPTPLKGRAFASNSHVYKKMPQDLTVPVPASFTPHSGTYLLRAKKNFGRCDLVDTIETKEELQADVFLRRTRVYNPFSREGTRMPDVCSLSQWLQDHNTDPETRREFHPNEIRRIHLRAALAREFEDVTYESNTRLFRLEILREAICNPNDDRAQNGARAFVDLDVLETLGFIHKFPNAQRFAMASQTIEDMALAYPAAAQWRLVRLSEQHKGPEFDTEIQFFVIVSKNAGGKNIGRSRYAIVPGIGVLKLAGNALPEDRSVQALMTATKDWYPTLWDALTANNTSPWVYRRQTPAGQAPPTINSLYTNGDSPAPIPAQPESTALTIEDNQVESSKRRLSVVNDTNTRSSQKAKY